MLLGRVFGICNFVEGHIVVLIQFKESMAAILWIMKVGERSKDRLFR